MAAKITQWSYSRWKTYSQCPRKAMYIYLKKMPTPSSPQMERGTLIHAMAEDYLNGVKKVPEASLRLFKDQLKKLRAVGASPEQELVFTKTWDLTGWTSGDAWLRMKLDAIAMPAPATALVVDFKTGKKYDDHVDQSDLYALGAFMAIPTIDTVESEFWYLDIGDMLTKTYRRADLPQLKKEWDLAIRPMLNDTKFAPLPSRGCLWCPFSKLKGGPCEF